jgi:hypothetical protein
MIINCIYVIDWLDRTALTFGHLVNGSHFYLWWIERVKQQMLGLYRRVTHANGQGQSPAVFGGRCSSLYVEVHLPAHHSSSYIKYIVRYVIVLSLEGVSLLVYILTPRLLTNELVLMHELGALLLISAKRNVQVRWLLNLKVSVAFLCGYIPHVSNQKQV